MRARKTPSPMISCIIVKVVPLISFLPSFTSATLPPKYFGILDWDIITFFTFYDLNLEGENKGYQCTWD